MSARAATGIWRQSGSNFRRFLTVALLLSVAAIVWFWAPIQAAITRQVVLRSHAVADSVLEELALTAPDPLDFLQSLWRTGNLAHRQFVATYLRDRTAQKGSLARDARALLGAAALDADNSVRALALAALCMLDDPQWVELAAAQLGDPDPELRLLGQQYLADAHSESNRLAPLLIRALDDPDPRVVVRAESILRRWTGLDFGVRMHHAIAKLTPEEPAKAATIPAEDLAAIRSGVQKRKEWWAEQPRPDLPTSTLGIEELRRTALARPPIADFTLPALDGSRIRLADFRGKIVLLNFWTTWCPACLLEIPDLIRLHQEFSDQLIILGISLDGAAAGDTHHSHDGHDHDHSHAAAGTEEPTRAREAREEEARTDSGSQLVRRFVRRHQIPYPILLDPEADIGARFRGGELPTNVLIDSQGRVRRRFIGARSYEALRAMILEARAG